MDKIELLEHELLNVIDKFVKENKDIRVKYNSNYSSGNITIKVIEQEQK